MASENLPLLHKYVFAPGDDMQLQLTKLRYRLCVKEVSDVIAARQAGVSLRSIDYCVEEDMAAVEAQPVFAENGPGGLGVHSDADYPPSSEELLSSPESEEAIIGKPGRVIPSDDSGIGMDDSQCSANHTQSEDDYTATNHTSINEESADLSFVNGIQGSDVFNSTAIEQDATPVTDSSAEQQLPEEDKSHAENHASQNEISNNDQEMNVDDSIVVESETHTEVKMDGEETTTEENGQNVGVDEEGHSDSEEIVVEETIEAVKIDKESEGVPSMQQENTEQEPKADPPTADYIIQEVDSPPKDEEAAAAAATEAGVTKEDEEGDAQEPGAEDTPAAETPATEPEPEAVEVEIEEIEYVDFVMGTTCNDPWDAIDILKTHYRLSSTGKNYAIEAKYPQFRAGHSMSLPAKFKPNTSVKKYIITWSRWNLLDMVREPNEAMPWWSKTREPEKVVKDKDELTDMNDNIVTKDEELNDLLEKVLEEERMKNEVVEPQKASPTESSPSKDASKEDPEEVKEELIEPIDAAPKNDSAAPADKKKKGNIFQRMVRALQKRFGHRSRA